MGLNDLKKLKFHNFGLEYQLSTKLKYGFVTTLYKKACTINFFKSFTDAYKNFILSEYKKKNSSFNEEEFMKEAKNSYIIL
jgi:hypothetical protein